MLKTIKVKKQMHLDELIKYAREKGLSNCQFTSNNNVDVYFSSSGYFLISGGKTRDGASRSIQLVDTFTVEVDEPITKDTKFTWLVEASDERIWNQKNASISDVLDEETKEIRALINGKLELIYERNEESINA